MTTTDIQLAILLLPTAALAVFLLWSWAAGQRDVGAKHDPAIFGWAEARAEARARMLAAVRMLAVNQYIRRIA